MKLKSYGCPGVIGRFVPHLCAWLERQGGAVGLVVSGVAEVQSQFALQVARLSQASPQRVLPDSAPRSWRVQAVDMSASAEVLHLVFWGPADERVQLILRAQVLRQWLGILHAQCTVGEWALEVWPSWLSVPLAASVQRVMALH